MKTKYNFLFLLCIFLSVEILHSQCDTNQFLQKIIINGGLFKSIYIYTGSKVIINKGMPDKHKSVWVYSNTSNTYCSSSHCWDVVDSIFYNLMLFDDNQGMTYPRLMFYNFNGVKYSNDVKILDYRLNTDTTLISEQPPLWNYILRIKYHYDTLSGPLFFDLQVRNDSLLLYIYVHAGKYVEIWNYADYYLLRKNLTRRERNKLKSSTPWVRTALIPVTLSAPFRVVHSSGQDYLITTEGDIYHIGKNSLEPAGKLPALPGKGILVIDKGKDAVYFMEERWMAEAQKRPLEEIINDNAVRILQGK
jgi:hypothetical protein